GLLGAIGAFQTARSVNVQGVVRSPWHYAVYGAVAIAGALVWGLIGGLIGRWLFARMHAIDHLADRRSAAELTVGALGLVVGLVAAVLAGLAVLALPYVGSYLFLPVAYIFTRIAARKHVDILRLVGIRPRGQTTSKPKVVDTSAIIDGRLIDVVRTRFLSGSIVVPAFVLEELHKVADSNDPLKRARGRRGLELVEEL